MNGLKESIKRADPNTICPSDWDDWVDSYIKDTENFGKSIKLLPSDQLGAAIMLEQMLKFMRGEKDI